MSGESKFKLEKIGQVCLVVKDIDKAMEAYWRVGIGPWTLWTYGPPWVKDPTYRGQPADHHWKLAFANAGSVVLELIEHGDGDTIYKEFLEKFGEGVQHLGVFVNDLEQAVKEAREAGFEVIQSGRGHGVQGDGAFAYIDTVKELGVVYELIQAPRERVAPERTYP